MQIHSSTQPPVATKSDILLFFFPEHLKVSGNLPEAVSFFVREFEKSKQFSGKKGEAVWVHRPKGVQAEWLLFFGLGDLTKLDATTISARIGQGIKTALAKKRPSLAVGFHGIKLPPATLVQLAGIAATRPGRSTRSSSGVRKSICRQKCSLLSVWPKSL